MRSYLKFICIEICRSRRVINLLFSSCLVTAFGCSESYGVPTYPVQGSLIINGEPAKDALVIFRSVGVPVDSKNSEPWGLVDANGEFHLRTYRKDDGAPEGEYHVSIAWAWELYKESPDRLNGAYWQKEHAIAQVTIKPETNVLDRFVLSGVRIEKRGEFNAIKQPKVIVNDN